MFKRPLKLRTRLALGYTAFFVLVLGLLGVGVFFTVRDILRRELQRQLETSADLIQQDFDASNDLLSQYFGDPLFLLRTFQQIEGLDAPTLFVQAVAPDGSIAASPTLRTRGRALPIDRSTLTQVLRGQAQTVEVQIGDSRVLMLVRPLLADRSVVAILQVAVPM